MFTPGSSFDKACSAKCRKTIEKAKPAKKSVHGFKPTKNMSRHHAKRVDPELHARMLAFKQGDPNRTCALCGRGHTKAHHVTYRQHCRAARADEWDPRNALNLCERCHTHHHNPNEEITVPLTALRDENIEFCVELYGADSAYMYLTRIYVGSDPRVDALG